MTLTTALAPATRPEAPTRTLSGIKPTGPLHLGHLLSALRPLAAAAARVDRPRPGPHDGRRPARPHRPARPGPAAPTHP